MGSLPELKLMAFLEYLVPQSLHIIKSLVSDKPLMFAPYPVCHTLASQLSHLQR